MKQIILIGDPVSHSRSPAMQNAAIAHLGLDLHFEAVHTPAADLAGRVAALRETAFLGANVTLPHKQAVMPLLDDIEPEAARIGAVNTIYKRDGRLIGANTDAPALIEDLRAAGYSPDERPAVILGASGAARAAAFALADAGAGSIVVANRSLARAEELLADLLTAITGDDGLMETGAPAPALIAVALDDPDLAEYVGAAGLLINATSLGWHAEETPLANPPVGSGCLVYDMVYRPTRLLHEAAARGAQTCAGGGMLVRQGALAFKRWTGLDAPLDVMRSAFNAAG